MQRNNKKGVMVKIAVLLLITLTFTGCRALEEKLGIAFPADEYVNAMLEAAYHGEYENYKLYINETEDEAKAHHEQYVEQEALYMAEYLNIENPTEETLTELETIVEQLYKKAEFQVESPIEKDNGLMVEVIVKPVDFFSKAKSDLDAYIKDYNQKLNLGQLDQFSLEEQQKQYQEGILEVCKKYVESSETQLSVSVYLQVKEIGEGYYTLEGDLSEVDKVIITYEK